MKCSRNVSNLIVYKVLEKSIQACLREQQENWGFLELNPVQFHTKMLSSSRVGVWILSQATCSRKGFWASVVDLRDYVSSNSVKNKPETGNETWKRDSLEVRWKTNGILICCIPQTSTLLMYLLCVTLWFNSSIVSLCLSFPLVSGTSSECNWTGHRDMAWGHGMGTGHNRDASDQVTLLLLSFIFFFSSPVVWYFLLQKWIRLRTPGSVGSSLAQSVCACRLIYFHWRKENLSLYTFI